MAFSREERKAHLAEATWRVILEQGVGAVSVRSVAAAAGVAVGSLRHLFPSQTDLLEFSAELMVERATARVTAIPPHADLVDYALEVIGHLIPLTPESRREFEINVALIAQTPAHPGLGRIRDHAHQQLLDLFIRIASALGGLQEPSPESELAGTRLLALVDGLGLHLLHQQPDDDTSWATRIIRDELVGLAGAGHLTATSDAQSHQG